MNKKLYMGLAYAASTFTRSLILISYSDPDLTGGESLHKMSSSGTSNSSRMPHLNFPPLSFMNDTRISSSQFFLLITIPMYHFFLYTTARNSLTLYMGMGVAAGPGVMRGDVVGVSLMGAGAAADVSSTRVEPELLSTGVAAGKALTGAGPVLLSTGVVSTGAGPTMLSTEASGT